MIKTYLLQKIINIIRILSIVLILCNTGSIQECLAKGLKMPMNSLYLVVDSSNSNGKVRLISYSKSGKIEVIDVVSHVSFFHVTGNGLLVYKSNRTGWFYSNIFNLKKGCS